MIKEPRPAKARRFVHQVATVTGAARQRFSDTEQLAYGAAEGGLLAPTKGFAREQILVCAVAPGWVATDLAAGVRGQVSTDRRRLSRSATIRRHCQT